MLCNGKINYESMKWGITRYLTLNSAPVEYNVGYLEIMAYIYSTFTYVTHIRNEIFIVVIFI